MPDTIKAASQHTASQQGAHSGLVRALVWAEDECHAAAAIEVLRHGLWPNWFDFQIDEVRQFPFSSRCPLRPEDPIVLASVRREQWMWVLVPLAADLGEVATCA